MQNTNCEEVIYTGWQHQLPLRAPSPIQGPSTSGLAKTTLVIKLTHRIEKKKEKWNNKNITSKEAAFESEAHTKQAVQVNVTRGVFYIMHRVSQPLEVMTATLSAL